MKAIGIVLTAIACCLFLFYCGARTYKEIRYGQDIGGHLKRAADANQAPLALEELEMADKAMDRWGLCDEDDPRHPDDCYTSVIYRTPDEDVNFWRENIRQTVDDLEALPEDADHLTVSNTLMKVRETLLDDGSSGVTVTAPSGIAIYPHNKTYCWGLFVFPLLLGCIGGIVWFTGSIRS